MWTSVKHARKHGWNVTKKGDAWVCGKLTSQGYKYNPFGWGTKRKALEQAHTLHKAGY